MDQAREKNHVATALGIQAIEHHRKLVRFFSTIELVNALEQEKAQGKAGKIAEALVKTDLVILDKLGYLLLSASGGRCCFSFSASYMSAPAWSLLQPELQRMGSGVRGRTHDHGLARSPYPSLPHPGNQQRQPSLQGQL